MAIYDCPPDPNSPSQGQSLELTCPRLEANGDNFTKKLYFCSQGTGTRKINITVSMGGGIKARKYFLNFWDDSSHL